MTNKPASSIINISDNIMRFMGRSVWFGWGGSERGPTFRRWNFRKGPISQANQPGGAHDERACRVQSYIPLQMGMAEAY
jgi:hypothetical protein